MHNGPSVFRVDGKVALIVGAASGIGQATALALAESGATVVCADVNLPGAQATAQRIAAQGAKASALLLDVTDRKNIDPAVDRVKDEYGGIDILVTTPAVNVRKRLLTYTDEELDRVVDLNLKGTFRVTRAAARVMAVQNRGSIILMSSIRSLVVEPGQGVYAATKASLVQLARGFAVELAPHGIRVNAVAPGVIDTPLTAPIKNNTGWYSAYSNRSAMKRWGTAEEIAWPTVFLASEASSYITGTVLFIDGGWTAVDGRFEPPL